MVVTVDRHAELDLFGIGTTLREARERRGLALADVERETCIRSANLAAIEDERFDDLPGDVYAAGFIRAYATLLDLDGERYAQRFRELRQAEVASTLPPLLRRDSARRGVPRSVLAAAVAVVVLGGIAIAVVRDRSDPLPRRPGLPGSHGRCRTRRHSCCARRAG